MVKLVLAGYAWESGPGNYAYMYENIVSEELVTPTTENDSPVTGS